MRRPGVILAGIVLAIGTTVRAGELDDEFGTEAKAIPSTPSAVASAAPGSELDGESPDQSCFFGRRRFFGYGGFGRFGYGGFGYGRFGYGGFGYGGFGRFGYGRFGYGYPGFGFGGFGYRRGFWW